MANGTVCFPYCGDVGNCVLCNGLIGFDDLVERLVRREVMSLN